MILWPRKTEAARAEEILQIVADSGIPLGDARMMRASVLSGRMNMRKQSLLGREALLLPIAKGCLFEIPAPLRVLNNRVGPIVGGVLTSLIVLPQAGAARLEGDDLRQHAWAYKDCPGFHRMGGSAKGFHLTLQRALYDAGHEGLGFTLGLAPGESVVELRIRPFTIKDEPDALAVAHALAGAYRRAFGRALVEVRPMDQPGRVGRAAVEIEFAPETAYLDAAPGCKLGGPAATAQSHPFFPAPEGARVLVVGPQEAPDQVPARMPLRIVMRPDRLAAELHRLGGPDA